MNLNEPGALQEAQRRGARIPAPVGIAALVLAATLCLVAVLPIGGASTSAYASTVEGTEGLNVPLPAPTQPPTIVAGTPTVPLPVGTAVPPPTPCPIQFTDVSPDSSFYAAVRTLACRGIMGGYSDGTFRPNNPVTRGQLSKIVSGAAGFSEAVAGHTFADLPPDNTFHVYVERMVQRSIIAGYSCGGAGEPCDGQNRPYFRPNNHATRGQIAKIVSGAAGLQNEVTGQTFADVAPTSPFYVYVERLVEREAMSGYNCGGPCEPCDGQNRPYFRPNNHATRGQTSKIVANTFFPGSSAPRP
jgi:hypothetical protein